MFSLRLSRLARLDRFIQPNKLSCFGTSQCSQKRTKTDLYEPDYLISMEPDEPVYDCLNLQIKGYDFALLEACQSQIHRYAEVMGLQVDDSWATPAKQLKVQRFKPNSTVVDAEYSLNVYERNVQKHGHKMMGALIGLLAASVAEFRAADSSSLKHLANVSFAAEDTIATASASMFSPRMDFEQWRPLTGRGDPLRNDPTYDYEPPVLERVHYWAEDTRLEREHYPERKSEVLMLGVSSRKPSIGARQPPPPSRRPHRPAPPKYEDFQYKLSDHYHMTILVPPPPPPPGHKAPLFILGDETSPPQTPHPKPTELIYETRDTTTNVPEHLTSLYALQESNLIYQSSTTNQNWILNSNHTKSNYSSVSSDYAGWGPTTPLDESDVNDTLNFILNDHFDLSKQPYAFYKPMLSEAPPPPLVTRKPVVLPTFIPTAPPRTEKTAPPLTTYTEAASTWTVSESFTETPEYYDDTTTNKQTTHFLPTPTPTSRPSTENPLFSTC
ncbi:hypothetical protein MSG28_006165 [Choristoneura fumiferana]|uniref:Uncharacterized protein n=1 Tax=Choristoneura fumiferana TaxID=7141 RepID=A0ACC0JDY5_CHOFU|nr:hypothetical protein MSG28_006165 [Choristoneura fumiferana]